MILVAHSAARPQRRRSNKVASRRPLSYTYTFNLDFRFGREHVASRLQLQGRRAAVRRSLRRASSSNVSDSLWTMDFHTTEHAFSSAHTSLANG